MYTCKFSVHLKLNFLPVNKLLGCSIVSIWIFISITESTKTMSTSKPSKPGMKHFVMKRLSRDSNPNGYFADFCL